MTLRLERSRGFGITALAAVWLCFACSPSGAVNAALREDLPTLKREIAKARASGDLDREQVTELAHAVVARELASASGLSGTRRVRSVRACATPVLDVLRRRSQGTDDVAAEALQVRIAQNDIATGPLVSRYGSHPNGAWRAVAARAALERRDVLLRRAWFQDPDQRVRRAALEAAFLSPDAGDLTALLEAFRLDPDPLSRSLAARAAGAIGGEAAVLGLKDRLARAEEADQLAVIDAWAMPASLRAGGARELRRVAEGQYGIVSVSAANALLASEPKDGALVGLLLTRMEHGTEEEQRLALLFAPLWDPRVKSALDRAARDSNDQVRVMALARLLSVPAARADAQKKLRELAAKDGSIGEQSRAALAAAGDRSVVAALAREIERSHPFRRQRAALALFRLGEPARAATALGDEDPGVRLAVACGVLAMRSH